MNDEEKFLKDKKILFLSPSFFNYEDLISEKLKQYGALVTLIKLKKDKKLHTKIEQILEYKKFDIIFIIKGEYLNNNDFNKINSNLSKNKILYLYDSLENYPNIKQQFNIFDTILTFEKEDADKYSLKFRPLFFNHYYREISHNTIKFDIASISSFYFNRYIFFNKILKENNKLRVYFKLYMSIKKLILLKFKYFRIQPSLFFFKPIKQNKVVKILSSAKSILDIKHPNQNGLTIRTIETLALRKKLITNNETIKEYDFYNPNNIFILNENNLNTISDFLELPYIDIKDEIVNKYSLDSFIKDVFSSLIIK